MYRLVKIINKVCGDFNFYHNNLIAICGDYLNSNLCLFDSNYRLTSKIESQSAYDFIIEKGNVLFTSQNATKSFNCVISDNQFNNLNELSFVLHLKGKKSDEKYFCFSNIDVEECYLLIDLVDFRVLQKYDAKKGFYNSKYNVYSGINLFLEKCFIAFIDSSIGLFNFETQCLWQHDLSILSSFTNYEGRATKGSIRNIYEYNDSVIVITQLFIFRINIERGDIIYSKKLPAGFLSLSLFQNRAFGCYGHHYLEIDLDSGEVINFNRIENEENEGVKYLAYMNEAYYDDELIYHGIRLSNGVHGVGIIDAKTGNRLFFHPTGVHNIEQIKVHREKLYVRDSENLHVFNKTIA
jgi:hypothetical protein